MLHIKLIWQSSLATVFHASINHHSYLLYFIHKVHFVQVTNIYLLVSMIIYELSILLQLTNHWVKLLVFMMKWLVLLGKVHLVWVTNPPLACRVTLHSPFGSAHQPCTCFMYQWWNELSMLINEVHLVHATKNWHSII